MNNRKYLPTLSELIDRLSIAQLKEVFIPEHKNEYAQEIADIVHDIQENIDDKNLPQKLGTYVKSFVEVLKWIG